MRRALVILVVLALFLGGSIVQADTVPRYETKAVYMADFSLQALHDEIELDPEGIGYKDGAVWKGDAEIAALINAKNYKVDRASVPVEDLKATVTYDAYNTLLGDVQEFLQWQTRGEYWRVTADMKLQLSGRTLAAGGVAGTGVDSASFWAAAHDQDMAPAMLALIEIDGSRAEVLWGEGRTVSDRDVAYAANQ